MLVALSGHGLQFELLIDGKKQDESFFCPADAKPRSTKKLEELSETIIIQGGEHEEYPFDMKRGQELVFAIDANDDVSHFQRSPSVGAAWV